MNKKTVMSAIISVALIISIYFIYQNFVYVSTDNAQVDGHFLLLASKVGGYVNEVHVQEGQKVKKDELLVLIDARDYENSLKQSSSELTSLEAKRRDAERSFKRISDLYSHAAVSQQQYDSANANFLEVKAKYEAAAAQLAQAQLNLDNTKIRAPSDGYIAKKSVEQGQLVSPGVPLFGFVDATDRWVTANFKETDLSGIKIGALVDIDVDAVTKKHFKGHVTTISAATGATFTLLPPDNATGNFTKVVQRVPVKIEFNDLMPEDGELLRVGLSAVVKVARH